MAKKSGNGLVKIILIGAIAAWLFSDDKNNDDLVSTTKSDQSERVIETTSAENRNPTQPESQVSVLAHQEDLQSSTESTTKPNFTSKDLYVDASRLNVRNHPSKSSKVIWTLKRDQQVSVTDQEGKWLYVQGDRFAGWVFGTYLTNRPTPKKKQPVISDAGLSTDSVIQILIERSHAYYSGSCPCPYNTTKNGRKCGKRSAYSRPGGASPLCYPSDVTAQMVAEFKARQ